MLKQSMKYCTNSEEVQIDLKEMERQFLHVKFVYSDKNLGDGHARNIGLQHATGKYGYSVCSVLAKIGMESTKCSIRNYCYSHFGK